MRGLGRDPREVHMGIDLRNARVGIDLRDTPSAGMNLREGAAPAFGSPPPKTSRAKVSCHNTWFYGQPVAAYPSFWAPLRLSHASSQDGCEHDVSIHWLILVLAMALATTATCHLLPATYELLSTTCRYCLPPPLPLSG